MKIERIDDNTVKCFLSNEELDAYEITYKDFVVRSDKAREVVEEIIEQAEEEVGYQPPKYAFDLQIMMLPEKGMILTFSEKDPGDNKADESLMECLKEMKQLLQEKKRMSVQQGSFTEEELAQQSAVSSKEPDFAVFVFNNLRDVCEYAAVLPANLRVKSSLYRMEDDYFLFMEKGRAAYEKYSRACIHALEFGALYTADVKRLDYLLEHAACLAEGQALKKLRIA